MVSKNIVFTAPTGLHARPAGDLVKIAKSFEGTDIKIDNGSRCVSAASMLSVLSLGVKAGAALSVSAQGPAEEQALNAVCDFLESVKD